ncbi:MAG: HAMP domain-containing histidine kinase, partial [Ktedonobacteraceae bacterium]|nr:HAMP domain-containing histidine kinase [Ktedonobacteraceae bacterium]
MVGRTRVKKYRSADLVLEHLPMGVAVYDAQEFRLLEANALFLASIEPFLDPCWLHGRIIGHPLTEFGASLHPLCSIDVFQSVVQHGRRRQGEGLPLLTQHGLLTYWSWTLDLIEVQAGVYHLLQTITDETDQEQRRQQASWPRLECVQTRDEVDAARKSIEQQKNEFVWTASHELRTPITIILGFAELLKMAETEEQPLNEPTRNALTHIIDQSEHLTLLIDAMFDILKIEQGQFKLDRAPHDLLALLVSIIKSQKIAARHHTFRLVLNELREQDLVIGLFDRPRMTQVLSNLINNAVKYSPEGGEIEIGLSAVGDAWPGEYREALIWVKDYGIGIAPDDLPHIFERFYRARSLDGYLSGFGIGLYVVKEVLTRHGGRVWVESTKGVGSTFYAWLPL